MNIDPVSLGSIDYDINAKGFFTLHTDTVVTPVVDPADPADPVDPTNPDETAEDPIEDPVVDPVVDDDTLPIGEYWNIDTSMSQMISSTHLSLVLTRVDNQNLDLELGEPIKAYFMTETKDSVTAKYQATGS